MEIVLHDYAATMSHDIGASKHPMEVMVQVTCTADFSVLKPPEGTETGSIGSQGSTGST